MHVNLSAGSNMVCNHLLIERNLHARCDLSRRGVKLVTQNLIVVDQGWTRCVLSMIQAWLCAITRRVEESATESLTCWVLLVFTCTTLLTTFGTRPLHSNIAPRALHVLLTIATV